MCKKRENLVNIRMRFSKASLAQLMTTNIEKIENIEWRIEKVNIQWEEKIVSGMLLFSVDS